MSPRRFFAYFLAVSAGSTVAFAPTLRGQPVPNPEAALMAADASLDALPPATVRAFQGMRDRRPHRPAAGVAQVRAVRVARAK